MFKIISVIAFNCRNKFLNKNLHSHFESEALLKSVMKEMRQTPEGVKSANHHFSKGQKKRVFGMQITCCRGGTEVVRRLVKVDGWSICHEH